MAKHTRALTRRVALRRPSPGSRVLISRDMLKLAQRETRWREIEREKKRERERREREREREREIEKKKQKKDTEMKPRRLSEAE